MQRGGQGAGHIGYYETPGNPSQTAEKSATGAPLGCCGSHMRRAPIILALVAVLAAAAASAGDAAGKRRAPEVWATVNACDTKLRPNQIGIRGAMTGLARRSRMYMRFRVQFQNSEGKWRMVKSSELTDSGWERVATGRRGEHDAGWTFEFQPRASGGAWELRGVVSFQWRRGDRVVQRDRRVTEDGHPGTAGAEPADHSAATCAIA